MPADEDFVLIPERFQVGIGGQEVVLTQTQFRILFVLVSAPGRLFTRAELVVRAIGTQVTERTVDAHVKEMRRRLGPHGSRIQTVRGCGYRYERGEVKP